MMDIEKSCRAYKFWFPNALITEKFNLKMGQTQAKSAYLVSQGYANPSKTVLSYIIYAVKGFEISTYQSRGDNSEVLRSANPCETRLPGSMGDPILSREKRTINREKNTFFFVVL